MLPAPPQQLQRRALDATAMATVINPNAAGSHEPAATGSMRACHARARKPSAQMMATTRLTSAPKKAWYTVSSQGEGSRAPVVTGNARSPRTSS